ncbi:hypothetical protein V6N11_012377 [Hibiscus sabdariffa]|uniref:LOB domain-containing protein n=2 Tax=Hibiscus sabdariffa TaxID=183260 RepID=A0ABR2AXS3_9ROSI
MSSNPSSSGGSVGGGGGGPCGACKFLRRKCVPGCIFAPYFDSEQGAAHFAAVHKVVNLQAELSYLQAHLSSLELPSPPPPPPSQTLIAHPPALSISDLPSASSVPAAYDLSSLFDPMVTQSTSWAMQQRQIDPRQFGGTGSSSSTGTGGDLQALARELLHSQGSPQLPCSDAPPSSSPSPPQSLSK